MYLRRELEKSEYYFSFVGENSVPFFWSRDFQLMRCIQVYSGQIKEAPIVILYAATPVFVFIGVLIYRKYWR